MTSDQRRRSLDELLPAVVTLFTERGYDATSMEDIARATGRTKSSVYHHVSGKEELLRLAVARAVDALSAVLAEPAAVQGRAVDRLEHAVRRSVEVLAEQQPYVTLLLRVRGNTGAEQWALAQRRELDRRLTELVTAAMAEGDLRADLDPRLVTRLLFGMVNSLVEWWRPIGPQAVSDVAEGLVAVVFAGLRGAGPPSSATVQA